MKNPFRCPRITREQVVTRVKADRVLARVDSMALWAEGSRQRHAARQEQNGFSEIVFSVKEEHRE